MTRRWLLLALLIIAAACDSADAPSVDPMVAPDGVLDCEVEGITMEVVTVGPVRATPRQAALSAAADFLHPGDGMAEVDPLTFSIVRAGHEVGILDVERTEAGGFVVLGFEGCVDDSSEVFTLP